IFAAHILHAKPNAGNLERAKLPSPTHVRLRGSVSRRRSRKAAGDCRDRNRSSYAQAGHAQERPAIDAALCAVVMRVTHSLDLSSNMEECLGLLRRAPIFSTLALI